MFFSKKYGKMMIFVSYYRVLIRFFRVFGFADSAEGGWGFQGTLKENRY